jgi:histidyl-tRNA synthetase
MIKSLKGTVDILPPDSEIWHYLESVARDIFTKYGYKEIRTPIIEPASLFVKSVGDGSDIVQKQMYKLTDQGGRDICLRPEETASVVRSYIQHNMHKTDGFVKLFYIGPMYRSERPQAGRQREFNQIGVEVIGSSDFYVDCEIIILLDSLLKAMHIKNYKFKINSLGCEKDRNKLKEQLKTSLKHDITSFCDDCQRRYNTNILRILDCKNKTCKNKLHSINISNDYMCEECRKHFENILNTIKKADINYTQDAFLVRGLDYYTRTVFEVTSSELGGQDAIAAGGRYDKLVSELGGPQTGACGFALGFERAVSLIKKDSLKHIKRAPALFIITLTDKARQVAFDIQYSLRKKGIYCDMDYQAKSLKAQMRYADKVNAKFVAVIGDDELMNKDVNLKNMKTGEQKKIAFDQLSDFILNQKT